MFETTPSKIRDNESPDNNKKVQVQVFYPAVWDNMIEDVIRFYFSLLYFDPFTAAESEAFTLTT